MAKIMRKNRVTLNDLLREKSAVLAAEGRHGSAGNYLSLCHYVSSRYGELPVKDFTASFAAVMRKDMEAEGKSPSTIHSYFTFISVVWHYAEYRKYVRPEDYPFRKRAYELDKTPVPKPTKRSDHYLSKDDMSHIYDIWKGLGAGKCRDRSDKKWVGLFLASYLCNGCNFADLLRLKYDSAWKRSGGRLLQFTRRKTRNTSGAVVRIPVTDTLREVISAVGNPEVYGGYVFPYMGDRDSEGRAGDLRVVYYSSYCSRVVSKFCSRLGIRDGVSLTYARHTYCHVLMSQNVNYGIIERNLGHALGVSDHYLGDVPVETLFQVNSLLL